MLNVIRDWWNVMARRRRFGVGQRRKRSRPPPYVLEREKAKREQEQAIPIELVKSSYQPTKAELEEDVRLPGDGGEVTMEDLKEIGRALVQPVDVTWRDKPRGKD